ncbi:MAG: histidine phosphatase family protein [Rhodobacteraceae bacterium]|nr:MAG: histidine phosphatase family protein [Paracoccaceae bacterium]
MQHEACELILVRHAPALTGGRLCGRVDVPADLQDTAALARTAQALHHVRHVVTSPAQRCRQTAAALFPALDPPADPRLWEQDFGVEDGLPYADLPDLGPLPLDVLAARQPDGGESFAQMVARVGPALQALALRGGSVAVIAHAGTARAGLALATGCVPAALAFEIAPLSLTRLRAYDGGFSVICTNLPA